MHRHQPMGVFSPRVVLMFKRIQSECPVKSFSCHPAGCHIPCHHLLKKTKHMWHVTKPQFDCKCHRFGFISLGPIHLMWLTPGCPSSKKGSIYNTNCPGVGGSEGRELGMTGSKGRELGVTESKGRDEEGLPERLYSSIIHRVTSGQMSRLIFIDC